ncbi:MAG TPA: OB-fold nucleic acid binding domain-containing protein, partial [Gemmatimonadaceae bacterium]
MGQRVRLGGWVHRARNLGGLVFVDLRDLDGIVQASFDPQRTPKALCDEAAALGNETVVMIEGDVVLRPEAMRNAELATGEIEVHVTSLT